MGSMPRILAICLPRWKADCARREAIRRGDREVRHIPTLIIRAERGQRLVVACCARASRAGVRPGMSLAHARALCPEPRHEAEESPERESSLLRACAIWCQRYAPITMIEPTPGPSAIIIDMTGCERVSPCERTLEGRVVAELARLGYAARVATASTAAAALALAQDGSAEDLAGCSLRALRLEPAVLTALALVNVRTVGELAALPRASIPSRYGEATLRRVGEATGEVAEFIVPIRAEPPPSAERIFDGPVTNPEAIARAAEGLVENICAQLLARDRGAREFELAACCADAPEQAYRLTLGAASAGARHIMKMLAPRLERMPMGLGVESLRLVVLRMGRLGPGDGIAEWIDTVVARLGPAGVLRAGFVEDHHPARATAWIRVARGGFSLQRAHRDASVAAVGAWRPSFMAPKPERVEVPEPHAPSLRWRRHAVPLSAWHGPERIASPWDRASADYWRVRTRDGQWLWLCRCGAEWTLAGIWS